MKTYIIIPTYNEAENIKNLVDNIFDHYHDINIMIVDDNSPDGTGDIADSLSKKYSSLCVIHRSKK